MSTSPDESSTMRFEPCSPNIPLALEISRQYETGKMAAEQQSEYALQASDITGPLRDLIEHLLPPSKVDDWLQDKDGFDGNCALDLLSVTDEEALYANIAFVADIFRERLTFVETGNLPTDEAIFESILQVRH